MNDITFRVCVCVRARARTSDIYIYIYICVHVNQNRHSCNMCNEKLNEFFSRREISMHAHVRLCVE